MLTDSEENTQHEVQVSGYSTISSEIGVLKVLFKKNKKLGPSDPRNFIWELRLLCSRDQVQESRHIQPVPKEAQETPHKAMNL